MITITYDAKHGRPFADGQVDDFVTGLIYRNSKGHQQGIVVSTENIITALRVAVREGKIAAQDVAFWYNGTQLKLYPDGGIETWPDGFADFTEKKLLKLF